MTVFLSPNAKQKFDTLAGAPAAGYKLYTYATGTTNPLATYSNRSGTTPNTNPIILDARGEATVYLTPGLVYDYKLTSGADVLEWTQPGVTADAGDAAAVAFVDPVAPSFLKTTSDIINGEAVSVLRGIDRTKHAGIFAGTNTDDHAAAINALLTDMAAAGRGHLTHEAGVIGVGSPLLIPSDTLFTGGGTRSIIKPLAVVASLVKANGQNARIRGLQLLNAGSFATTGVDLAADFTEVSDCYFANLPRGIQISTAQALRILRNTIIGSDFGIFSANDGRNSVIDNCHIQGGTSVYLTKTTIQNEGTRITNCFLAPSTTTNPLSGHGVVIEGGLEIIIANNIIDNVDKYGLYLPGTLPTEGVKLLGNWIGCDPANAGSGCVYTLGPVKQVQLLGNTFTGANSFGVNVDFATGGPPNGFDISHNRFVLNVAGDLRMDSLLTSVVSSNLFNSSTISTTEQDNTSSITVADNAFTLPPAFKSSLSNYKDNQGPDGVNTNYGTYTPTLTNVTNVSASGAYLSQWQRIGDVVTVSGRVDLTPTSAGTLSTLRMSLPVASNFTGLEDAGGSANGYVNQIAFGIGGDGATDTVVIQGTPALTGSQPMGFSFTYRVK